MTRIGLVAVLLLLGTGFAGAQGNEQCDNFAWSLSRERTLFADPGKITITSGQTVAEIPKSAFVLLLKPIDDALRCLPNATQNPRRLSAGWPCSPIQRMLVSIR